MPCPSPAQGLGSDAPVPARSEERGLTEPADQEQLIHVPVSRILRQAPGRPPHLPHGPSPVPLYLLRGSLVGPVFTGEGRPAALLNGPPTAPRARVAGGIRGGAVLEPGLRWQWGFRGWAHLLASLASCQECS